MREKGVREKWEEKTWKLEGEAIAIKNVEEVSRRKLENERHKYQVLANEVLQHRQLERSLEEETQRQAQKVRDSENRVRHLQRLLDELTVTPPPLV